MVDYLTSLLLSRPDGLKADISFDSERYFSATIYAVDQTGIVFEKAGEAVYAMPWSQIGSLRLADRSR
ncbi:hypothetical protein AAG596_03345 [Citromicrobium bathyomarinum]